jgi:hypothetical protein
MHARLGAGALRALPVEGDEKSITMPMRTSLEDSQLREQALLRRRASVSSWTRLAVCPTHVATARTMNRSPTFASDRADTTSAICASLLRRALGGTKRLLPALFALIWASLAAADPVPLNAKLIWAREGKAYIALLDSAAAATQDMRILFTRRDETIATGVMVQIVDRELGVVRIDSGDLPGKRLDRVKVVAEPVIPPGPTRLRVGFPARSRASLLFACRGVAPRAVLTNLYQVEAADHRSYHMVRRPEEILAAATWPETLDVRLYDEVADQEIALERGELDVAVFWPGELSPLMRERPRWQGFPFGIRRRGVVVAIGSESSAADAFPIGSLDANLFRGDLVSWEEAVGLTPWRATEGSSSPPRFEVDPSIPGRSTLEKYLNGARRTTAPATSVVRVVYLDQDPFFTDSLALGIAEHIRNGPYAHDLRVRADSLASELQHHLATWMNVSPIRDRSRAMLFPTTQLGEVLRDRLQTRLVYAIGCPAVCSPKLRPYVDRFGTDLLVSMMECLP